MNLLQTENSLLVGCISVLVTGIVTVIVALLKGHLSRLKLAQVEYTQIIKSNTDFRNEIKADLNNTRKELSIALSRIEELKDEVDKSRMVIFKMENQIKIKDAEIHELNVQILRLQSYQKDNIGSTIKYN